MRCGHFTSTADREGRARFKAHKIHSKVRFTLIVSRRRSPWAPTYRIRTPGTFLYTIWANFIINTINRMCADCIIINSSQSSLQVLRGALGAGNGSDGFCGESACGKAHQIVPWRQECLLPRATEEWEGCRISLSGIHEKHGKWIL